MLFLIPFQVSRSILTQRNFQDFANYVKIYYKLLFIMNLQRTLKSLDGISGVISSPPCGGSKD